MWKSSVLALALLLALAHGPGVLADSGVQPAPEQSSLDQPAPSDDRATGPAEPAAAGAQPGNVPLLPLVVLAILSPLILTGVVFAMYRIANKPRQRQPR